MQFSDRIIIPLSLIFLIYLFLSSACSHESQILDEMDTICFDSQILPLIQNSCGTTGCHDGFSVEEGFNASSYETIIQAVKPGYPKESKLYNVLTSIWGENIMPPDSPLSLDDRNLIRVWIAQGALMTTCNSDTIDETIPDESDTLCFQQDILPVFQSGCAISGCHDAATHTDGYSLSDYASIMSNDEGIVPFNPNSSEIFEVITENDPGDRMPPPPRNALTNDQIENIRTWILNGALNSNCPQNICDTLSVISFSNQVFPVIENNCLSCHNASTTNGGISLSNYQNVKSVIETERDNNSLLIAVINRLPGFSSMPPYNSLYPCDIRIIELWVEQGYENN